MHSQFGKLWRCIDSSRIDHRGFCILFHEVFCILFHKETIMIYYRYKVLIRFKQPYGIDDIPTPCYNHEMSFFRSFLVKLDVTEWQVS